MYGDQFGEFVCGQWSLEGLIRTNSVVEVGWEPV